MRDLEKFITKVSDNLDDVFKGMNTTVELCSSTAKKAGSILGSKKTLGQEDLSTAIEVEKLKESVLKMATLFQFGDIISQSFESFDVIFDELKRFKSTDEKLDLDQAERFAKLLGAVSTSTFSLIGTTLLQLKDQLKRADGILENLTLISCEGDLVKMVKDSKESITASSQRIDGSARYSIAVNEKMGLFCVENIISNTGTEDSGMVKRLYEKFRVRTHVEILNEVFPEDRDYSNTGSLELF